MPVAQNFQFLLLLFVFVASVHCGDDIRHETRIRRQSEQRNKNPGNGHGGFPFPGNGYPPVPNYNYNPYAYPQFNPYQQQPYSFPGNPGNININIPPVQQAPAPVSVPNINNVIYGPSPPSNVNNNFYGPTLTAAAAPKEEKKEKFCNANTEFNCYNGKCLTDPHQLCDGKNDCGNRVDEMNCQHLNYQIRLRSENDESDSQDNFASRFNPPPASSYSQVVNRNEGIIEVSVRGQRGCLCNRNFDIHDADVACRELGFRKGCEKINRVSRTKASELFSDGVPYLMDNINCIGNETSLRECDFDGWGKSDRSCGRRNIVSISCKTDPPPAAPVGPVATSSRFNYYDDIEVNQFPPPQQKRVEFDPPAPPSFPQFPIAPAQPEPERNPSSSHTGFSVFTKNTTTVIQRDETQVAEGNSEKCAPQQFSCKTTNKCIPIAWVCDRTSDCEDNSDESLEGCNQPIQVRLSNGIAVSEGRLEIRVHGIWGTVCDKNFGVNEAGVFCRSLGFMGRPQILKDSSVGEGKGPIWLENLACPADDTCCITSCNNLNWGRSSCSHAQDVVLRCSNLLRLN